MTVSRSVLERDIVRFWAKVDIRGPDDCWLWTAGMYDSRRNYGGFLFRGRPRRAHIIAYYLHYGTWPEYNVCHSCDNGTCCNPAHLFDGTQQTNIEDRDNKGRQARGQTNGGAKLTAEEVLTIRATYAIGHVSYTDLSKQYNVSPTTIHAIVHRKKWRHI